MSESGRKNAKDWFENTLLSRLNNKQDGCIIIVMQRLHEDDLTGHVLAQEGWEVLSFPAIAMEDEVYNYTNIFGNQTHRRFEGEVLHPERETLQSLMDLRARMGESNFSAQYQQQPLPPGGAIIKRSWFLYYDEERLPEFIRIVQSWDTAVKAHDRADFSVCTTWGVAADRKVYLLDVYRERLEFPELKHAVKRQAAEFKPHNILIEDKASGPMLLQQLDREGVQGLTPYNVLSFEKVMRVHAQTLHFAAGAVRVPHEAPWLLAYLSELTGFPGSKHDDQVDSTINFLHWITDLWKPSVYDYF